MVMTGGVWGQETTKEMLHVGHVGWEPASLLPACLAGAACRGWRGMGGGLGGQPTLSEAPGRGGGPGRP